MFEKGRNFASKKKKLCEAGAQDRLEIRDKAAEIISKLEAIFTFYCLYVSYFNRLRLKLSVLHSVLFLIYFGLFQTNITILQQINLKNVHPMPGFELTTFRT